MWTFYCEGGREKEKKKQSPLDVPISSIHTPSNKVVFYQFASLCFYYLFYSIDPVYLQGRVMMPWHGIKIEGTAMSYLVLRFLRHVRLVCGTYDLYVVRTTCMWCVRLLCGAYNLNVVRRTCIWYVQLVCGTYYLYVVCTTCMYSTYYLYVVCTPFMWYVQLECGT